MELAAEENVQKILILLRGFGVLVEDLAAEAKKNTV